MREIQKSVYDQAMSQTSLQKSSNALFSAAKRLKLAPEWITPWGLMSVQINGIEKYLFMSKTLLNTQISSYLSANKHATRAILGRHGLRNIPYCSPSTLSELASFFETHQPIIGKPTMGQRAEGILLVNEASELPKLPLSGMIYEKYISGPEVRYLVLQGQVIAVQQKIFETEIYSPENSKRVSFPPEEWDLELSEIAKKIARILELGFCAVDFKQDQDKKWFILEVNSAPALWRFEAPDEGPAVAVSELLLKAVIAQFTSPEPS